MENLASERGRGVLVVAVMLVVASVGIVGATVQENEGHSTISVLTEDEDGEWVGNDYPTQLALDESQQFVVSVENHEQQPTAYTVVVVEQVFDFVDGERVLTEQRELDQFEGELVHEETWTYTHAISPTIAGEDVRIVWLLYLDDEVPSEPSTANAAYHVHLWFEVIE
ncbi:DUF1616 domain-containing protein [Natrialbaceae archaeon A-CW1-1]